MKIDRKSLPLILALLLALTAFGCGTGESDVSAANTGHESHDNAPGEHPEPTGHEGHDNAPGEHPEDGQMQVASVEDWCYPHSVPESECTKCHPELIEQFKETNDWCPPHDLPESHCRLCNPEISWPQEALIRELAMEQADDDISVSLFFRPNSPICATNDALIQFASAETAERAGLAVHRVRAAEMRSSVGAPAEVKFDEGALTVVASTVPALVSRWLVSPGDAVAEGDAIAVLQSPDMADLQAKLLSAYAANEVEQKEVARHEQLRERDLISQSDYEQRLAMGEAARAAYISYRGLLKSAGLSETDIDEIIEYKKVTNQFVLRAPASGLVVERIAQVGELVDAGRTFAMVADPSSMWIEARLTEEQIRRVQVGQPVTFSSDGRGLARVGARVIWVSRVLDQHSRTGTVRAEVIDSNHSLNAGEFGRVEIGQSGNEQVAMVPKDAVQWEGCCNVVFVKETPDRYRPRKVDLIDGEGPYYQVTSGLEPGEEVVVNGAFLLKTELKKTSIGAGCCGLDPVG